MSSEKSESKSPSLFSRATGLAKRVGDSVAGATVGAATAVAGAASSAATAVVDGAKSLVPEKKPETELVFFCGDFLIFEDRFERRGRKYYFGDVKNVKIGKRVETETTFARDAGSIAKAAALAAVSGAVTGGAVGAVAGGLTAALSGGAVEKKETTTRDAYLIGFPERADKEDVVFESFDASEAREVLRETVAAFERSGAIPTFWRDGRRVDADKIDF